MSVQDSTQDTHDAEDAELIGKASEVDGPSAQLDIEAQKSSVPVASPAPATVPSPAFPEFMGIPMKYWALVMLTAMQSLAPLQTSWTRHRNIEAGGPRYLNSSIIIFSELLKIILSFGLLTPEEGGVVNAAKRVYRQVADNLVDTAKITIPALLYAVQNNLLYFAMDKLSPPVFQVTYQLKILTTAFLSVIMLGKQLGPVKWIALVLLTVGITMVQLQGQGNVGADAVTTTAAPVSGGAGTSDAAAGLIAVLLACCTSGLAGVYLEKMLKMSGTSIWMRNVQLGTVGAVMACLTAGGKDFDKIIEGGLAQGYTHREAALVLQQASAGLASAAVLKYADNILKCFAAGAAVILVSIITMLFLEGFSAGVLFCGGSAFVIAAIFMYNVGVPDYAQKWVEQGMKMLGSIDATILPASHIAGDTRVQ